MIGTEAWAIITAALNGLGSLACLNGYKSFGELRNGTLREFSLQEFYGHQIAEPFASLVPLLPRCASQLTVLDLRYFIVKYLALLCMCVAT